jgi:hypothetical protein
MGVMVVCGLLLAVGVAVTIRSADGTVGPPVSAIPASTGAVLRRCIWWVELLLATVLATGIMIVGAGGRLAMRLLGAAAGAQAQGRLTDAEEVVGEITLEGTVGFFIFVGILFALATTLLYFAIRGLLPGGRLGGLAFGAALMLIGGHRVDPLRPESVDFDLLGPWWLAVVVFTALALLQGAAIVAFAGAISRRLPMPALSLRSWPYLLLLVLIPLFPLGALAALATVVVLLTHRYLEQVRRWLASPRPRLVGRAVLALAVAASVPGFLLAVADLSGRGPSL